MKILYRARTDTYRFYREGINPSHWLYGAVEMEKEGKMILYLRKNEISKQLGQQGGSIYAHGISVYCL